MRLRRGLSLIELLVVVAILALVMGLGLAAVQRARLTALKIKSANNLRQIALCTQQLADQNGGVIKNLAATNLFSRHNADGGGAGPDLGSNYKILFTELLPYTGATLPYFPPVVGNLTPEEVGEYLDKYDLTPNVALYASPADPSLAFLPPKPPGYRDPGGFGDAPCSYSYNAQVFTGTVSLTASIPDGLSNTISFVERYYQCGPSNSRYRNWNQAFPPFEPENAGNRRPTFADRAGYDVVPIRAPDGRTLASRPGTTFQVRPAVELADTTVPQTPYDGGLLVAFFDGSVRTIRGGVGESAFWGMVTPAGGEVASDE